MFEIPCDSLHLYTAAIIDGGSFAKIGGKCYVSRLFSEEMCRAVFDFCGPRGVFNVVRKTYRAPPVLFTHPVFKAFFRPLFKVDRFWVVEGNREAFCRLALESCGAKRD